VQPCLFLERNVTPQFSTGSVTTISTAAEDAGLSIYDSDQPTKITLLDLLVLHNVNMCDVSKTP